MSKVVTPVIVVFILLYIEINTNRPKLKYVGVKGDFSILNTLKQKVSFLSIVRKILNIY